MAATADEIVSMAMELLGHTPFTQFSLTSDVHHRAAERAWPTVRDRVLSRGTWDCATVRVKLTVDTIAPAYGFLHRYALPANWLRTVEVGEGLGRPAYRIESDWILCNVAADLPFRYVYRLTDVNKYPAHLTEAMVHGVAARMAYAVTQSTSKASAMADEFDRVLTTALALDNAETDGDVLGDFPLIDARFGYDPSRPW